MKILIIIVIIRRRYCQEQKVVKYNEKFNVPEQTEEEEAGTHENAEVEDLADDSKIKRKKSGLQFAEC